MNYDYDYEIEINYSVTEFENELYNGNWNFRTLRRDFSQFENNYDSNYHDIEIMNCFARTRNWVIENHIKILL